MSHAKHYIPLGVTQQGRLVPTLEAAMNTDIEPWHHPHFKRGAEFGVTEYNLDQRQQEKVCKAMPLPDLLLAKGAMTGPYRRTHPVRNRPVRRFFRAALAFLLARRPYL
jgi:hypothetical protein